METVERAPSSKEVTDICGEILGHALLIRKDSGFQQPSSQYSSLREVQPKEAHDTPAKSVIPFI